MVFNKFHEKQKRILKLKCHCLSLLSLSMNVCQSDIQIRKQYIFILVAYNTFTSSTSSSVNNKHHVYLYLGVLFNALVKKNPLYFKRAALVALPYYIKNNGIKQLYERSDEQPYFRKGSKVMNL
jgi:hypothetical protein